MQDAGPAEYVNAILSVHNTYHNLVITAFDKDKEFVRAHDKVPLIFLFYFKMNNFLIKIIQACEQFVNRNALTENGATGKSAELIALYSHQLLKKSAKNPDPDEMEKKLSQVIAY